MRFNLFVKCLRPLSAFLRNLAAFALVLADAGLALSVDGGWGLRNLL